MPVGRMGIRQARMATAGDRDRIPVRFYRAVNDNGSDPDQLAGDGMFSSEGEPGPMIDQYTRVTVRVGAMDMSGHVAVADRILNIGEVSVDSKKYEEIPGTFALYQNYPNPFNPSTQINYDLPSQAKIVIEIFDVLGRKVDTLLNQRQQPGHYSVTWDGRDEQNNMVPSGVYICRLRAESFIQSLKMLVIR